MENVGGDEPRISERPCRFRFVQRFVIRDCLLMAATRNRFYPRPRIIFVLVESAENVTRMSRGEKERKEKFSIDIPSIGYFSFCHGVRGKDSPGSRFKVFGS